MTENDADATYRIQRDSSIRQLAVRSLRIRVREGADKGKVHASSLPVVRVGTAPDNDLVLTDETVSRHHAEIVLGDAGLTLRDLGSTNGSFVGGIQVKEALVPASTPVELGKVTLELSDGEQTLVAAVKDVQGLGGLVGASPAMQQLYALLEAAAPAAVSVLIHGESGTGKERIAQVLHERSGRKGPLVVFDAAATDVELIRSELFGHEKGAFTGANGPRAGAFREADGGTLLIDEIGELPLDLQPRLLRVLESRQVQPLGSDKRYRVDVRVLAATHRDLPAMVAEGAFRADLYHRLAVVPVEVPPLRERPGDVRFLVARLCDELGLALDLTPEALAALEAHAWPGNVRELRNVLERTSVLVRGRPVEAVDLRLDAGGTSPPGEDHGAGGTLRELERDAIAAALERNDGNKAATARELGIGLSTLKDKLKRYQDEG